MTPQELIRDIEAQQHQWIQDVLIGARIDCGWCGSNTVLVVGWQLPDGWKNFPRSREFGGDSMCPTCVKQELPE